jgi:hypothetical protein
MTITGAWTMTMTMTTRSDDQRVAEDDAMTSVLEFRPTMDPHSVDVFQSVDGEAPRRIAMLQWHPERPPALVALYAGSRFTCDEMRAMVAHLTDQLISSTTARK